jgi:hypothetical protein
VERAAKREPPGQVKNLFIEVEFLQACRITAD